MPDFTWEKDSSTSGEVTRVIDGDTVEIKTPKGDKKRIRLANTDAPEYVQKDGDKAKQALEKRVPIGESITIYNTKQDKHGRTVGNVVRDGVDVGEEMVKAKEVGAYGQKASLLDRVMGKKDPASFRHGDGSNKQFEWEGPISKQGSKDSGDFTWEGPVSKQAPKDDSLWGSVKAGVKSAVEGIPGAAGGVVGAEAALAVGSPLVAASGPWAPVTGLALMAVGGIGGAIAGHKTGEVIMDQVPNGIRKDIGFDEKTREKEKLQNPTSSFIGDLASSAPFFRPGKVSTMEKALGAVMGGAFETGSQIASGEDINLGHIALATGWGGIASKSTKLTEGVSKAFGNDVRKAAWETANKTASEDAARKQRIDTLMGKYKTEEEASIAEKESKKGTEKGLTHEELLAKFTREQEENDRFREENKVPEDQLKKKQTFEEWVADPANGVVLGEDVETINKGDGGYKRHPAEDIGSNNGDNHKAAVAAAADAGITFKFHDDIKGSFVIDIRKSTINLDSLKNYTDIKQVLTHIEPHVPLEYKALIGKMLENSDADFKIVDKFSDPNAGDYVLGQHWSRGLDGSSRALIEIPTKVRGIRRKGEVDLGTLLHEALHNSTVRNFDLGMQGDPRYKAAARDLTRLFEDIGGHADASAFLNHYSHALDDPYELMTYGLTDPNVKRILSLIKFKDQETAWTKFVSTVLHMLGIPKGESTAYTRLLEITDRIMSGTTDAHEQPKYAKEHPTFNIPTETTAELLARHQKEMNDIDVYNKSLEKMTGLDREKMLWDDGENVDDFTYGPITVKRREELARKLFHTTGDRDTQQERVKAWLESTDKDVLPNIIKTKLDRQKDYWTRKREKKGASKPWVQEQDDFGSVRQDPPEDKMPRTETRTLDLYAESKYHENKAREIYHMDGPEAAKAYLEQTIKQTPTIIRELEDAIGININNNVAISRRAANFRKELEALLPDEKARMELPGKIEKGLPLTKEEQAAVDLHKKKMDEIGKMAYDTGLIKGLLENYVSRRGKAANIPDKEMPSFIEQILNASFTGPDLKKTSKSGLERVFESLEQTELALAAKGMELEKDIAKIAEGYMLDMLQAIEGKQLWTKLQETTIGDFKAAIPPNTKTSLIPKQYEFISHGAYRGWAIHPDIKPALDFVLGARDPGVFLKAALTFNSAIKKSNIAASFFHAKSLIEAAVMARNYIGTGDISLKKVLEMYHTGGEGDSADKWLKGGMIMSGGVEDVSRTVLSDLGKVVDQLSGKYGNKNYAERALTFFEKNTLGKIDKITWDFLHDGLKLMVAEHKLQQAMKDHPNIPESTHRAEIVGFVNNSFGGLNWYDIARKSENQFMKRLSMAAFNPEGRRAMQAVLFAPDWTVSTLRSFTTALPKELFNPASWDVRGGVHGLIKPRTQADYARGYQMKFALMYLTVLNGINMMTSGHPIWDNKDPTRIEFEDGTTMQATKHAMEAIHAGSNPDQFISNKLGFIPKAAIVSLAGVEYAGPTAPKLEDNTLQGRINAISKTMVPFSVSSVMNAPKGEEVKRALSSTLGFPIYGETQAQKAEKRAERRQRTYNERVKEWKKQGLMGDE